MRKFVCVFLSLSLATLPLRAQFVAPGASYSVSPAYTHKGEATKMGYINNLADHIYLSFPEDVQTLGPLYPLDDNVDRKKAEDYVKWTFREIIRKAHSFIHDKGEFGFDPEGHVNFSYFSFLVLALTVPHHESHLMHFRQQSAEACSQKTNSLERSGYRTKKVLGEIYRQDHNPLIPDCEKLKNLEQVRQLIMSYTYEDLGIMQVNPYWHKVAMEPSILLSTSNFIQYGIEYLFDGFIKVRRNLDNNPNYYPCSMESDPYGSGETQPKIFYNILRATWASKYNAGSAKKICRFVETNKYDDGFEAALQSIVVGGTSIYHRYLPENSLERAVLQEILNNYYRIYLPGIQDEETENLQTLLSMPARMHENWIPPQRISQYQPTHTLVGGNISIYAAPSETDIHYCGKLRLEGAVAPQVQVVDEEFYRSVQTGKNVRWAEVTVSDYATYLDIHGIETKSELRSGKSVVNLRSEPGNLAEETKVAQLQRNRSGESEQLKFIKELDVDGVTWLEMQIEEGQNLFVESENKTIEFQENQTVFAHGDWVQKVEAKVEAPSFCRPERLYIQSSHLRHLPVEYELGVKYQAVVNGSGGLNVRRCCGLQCDVLTDASLNGGDIVTVVGDDSENGKRVVSWYEVILENGIKGCVWHPRIDLIEKMND